MSTIAMNEPVVGVDTTPPIDSSIQEVLDMPATDNYYIDDHPHIHVHFKTDGPLMHKYGFGLSEACCHSCGAVTALIWDPPKEKVNPAGYPGAKKVLEDFSELHQFCDTRDPDAPCIQPRILTVMDCRGFDLTRILN